MHKKNIIRFVLALVVPMPVFQLCARDYDSFLSITIGGGTGFALVYWGGRQMIDARTRYNDASKHMYEYAKVADSVILPLTSENTELVSPLLQYLWYEKNSRFASFDFNAATGLFVLGVAVLALSGNVGYYTWKDLPYPNYWWNPLDPQST